MKTNSRCELRRQDRKVTAAVTKVAARGTPDADATDDKGRLTTMGNNPSRATLNRRRAPIMRVAIIALKMARTTIALKARAAQGPRAWETNVANGAGLANTAGKSCVPTVTAMTGSAVAKPPVSAAARITHPIYR